MPRSLGTADWCEANVLLSPRVPTPDPGNWKRYFVEALTRPGGPLEALDDPTVETVVVEKGAQTGLTTTAYCWLAKQLATDPAPALVVMNSETDAKEKSDETWRPIWEDSPMLRRFLPYARRKEWTKLFQRINGAPVYWVGANSPGRLGAKPVRYLILDEVDKYPQQTKRETGALRLAVQRVKAFRRKALAKVLIFSTPTVENGDVHAAFLEGDQRFFILRCPRCGKEQRLNWAQMFFSDDINPEKAVASGRYECADCHARLDDDERGDAISGGYWEPTAVPKDPRCRSYRLPSAASKLVTNSYLIAQYLKARESTGAMQDFMNGEMAEPYTEPPKKSAEASQITAVRDKLPYERGTVPTEKPCILVLVVDVQLRHIPYSVWAMDPWNQWLVDHGHVAHIEDVAVLFQTVYRNSAGNELRCRRCLMDMRFRTMECYRFALAHPWVIPIMGERGVKTRGNQPVVASQITSFPGGKLFGGNRSLTLLHIHPSLFKDQFSAGIDASMDDPSADGGRARVRVWFHQDIDRDYIWQLRGEVLREGKPDRYGNAPLYWLKVHTNDQFDCAQYGFAARHVATNELLQLRYRPAKEEPDQQPEPPPEQRTEPAEETAREPAAPPVPTTHISTPGPPKDERRPEEQKPEERKPRKKIEAWIDPNSIQL